MTFLTSFGTYVRNALCTTIDTLQDFGLSLRAGGEYRAFEANVDILRLVQRLACNREPSPEYDAPFTGGQCLINYTVNVQWRRTAQIAFVCQQVDESASVPAVAGKISGLEVVATSSVERRLQIIHGANGELRTPVFTYTGSMSCPAEFVSFSIINVVPPVGVPDNCGDPFPVPPPSTPGSRTYNEPFTYVNNEGDTITIDASVTFGDINFGRNGDMYVTGRVTFQGDTYEPTFNFIYNISGDEVRFKPGNPNYPPSGNPNGDNFGTEEPPEYPPSVPNSIAPPTPNEPDPGTTQVIRAVVVTVTNNDSDATEIFQDTNPNIYAPNLGYINFAIATGAVIAWTADIPIKNYRQFIPCPWEGGALDVRGTPRVGVDFTISAVYGALESEQVYV